MQSYLPSSCFLLGMTFPCILAFTSERIKAPKEALHRVTSQKTVILNFLNFSLKLFFFLQFRSANYSTSIIKIFIVLNMNVCMFIFSRSTVAGVIIFITFLLLAILLRFVELMFVILYVSQQVVYLE